MSLDGQSALLSAGQESLIAIAWCLAWGDRATPQYPIESFRRWRSEISNQQMPADSEWQQALEQASALAQLEGNPQSLSDISTFTHRYPALWESRLGLIYGGVTKVKSYVFESADLQEIRGASALLDRINLVDLPALFHTEEYSKSDSYKLCRQAPEYCKTVRNDAFAKEIDSEIADFLPEALIPELIVYSTGGNILAFCPPAFIDALCTTIENRYTTQTLTANSCAVGAAFRVPEIYCGLLKDPLEITLWHDKLIGEHKQNKALQAYFGFDGKDTDDKIIAAFNQRKNFGEIVSKLTSQFNQRRGGDDSLPLARATQIAESRPTRPSRRYPPMFETHPYLMRDDSDVRSAVTKVDRLPDKWLPDEPTLSEPTARKRRVGQITKRYEVNENWYRNSGFKTVWNPEPTKDSEDKSVFQSWVSKFENFLKTNSQTREYDPERRLMSDRGHFTPESRHTREARSLHEIGDRSQGYVGYIYADGNSMGEYIRKQIKTPVQYRQFSQDIFEATEQSVYFAIAQHLSPQKYKPDAKSSRENKAPVWIHPFEIITIGGDDVLLVVPANKALEIAQTIGDRFEEILLAKGERYRGEAPTNEQKKQVHRYLPEAAPPDPEHQYSCKLSTSSGVLITAADTPIYYADKLVSQLLKSAKKHLKLLKPKGYYGGTVDFLVLKAVTMITSDIEAFRQTGLTIAPAQQKHSLKLYAAPYTLHELGGLVDTVRALKQSQFPKSQLYQIRSLLTRGKRTAILNYRYFRVRLEATKRQLVEDAFENAWCKARTNSGNLAPWMTPYQEKPAENESSSKKKEKTVYETIWRELVDLEPFIDSESPAASSQKQEQAQPAGESIGGVK